ncbi:MAG: hypothetical protein A2511_04685 [Deltaproteobacteria bacterium RIFOXYD12_FULL_50_9]|nr:MAG: hypothetical protein A2511_04685 [Deltaproteobacteria bacterium RIFOXYD12_FULL_50_9]
MAAAVEQTFTAIYSDADGYANLKSVNLLVVPVGGGTVNAILARYDRNENIITLANDSGVMPTTGGCAPGSTGILENSQGSINCQLTTVSGSGSDLTVTWKIPQKNTYAGSAAKPLKMRATDNSGVISGWSNKGSWTITPAPPPVVSISAVPGTIMAGQKTTLYFSCSNATAITIDQGVGPVTGLSFVEVSPAQTTEYTITATGPGGIVTARATVTVLAQTQLGLEILSPLQEDILSGPWVTVEGVVTTVADEVSITVNGMVALVSGNRFFANHVSLVAGDNLLAVKATDSFGRITEKSITVSRDYSLENIQLIAGVESGLAPLATTLRMEANFVFSGKPVVSYDGPAVATITETVVENTYDVQINTPGLYIFTVEALDENGIVHADSVAVLVMDKEALDTLLNAKWGGMKTALAARNIEGALAYFLESSKEKYRGALNAIAIDLPQIVTEFQSIELIFSSNTVTKYRINRQHIINGASVTLTYYIYFVQDENGTWRIEQF